MLIIHYKDFAKAGHFRDVSNKKERRWLIPAAASCPAERVLFFLFQKTGKKNLANAVVWMTIDFAKDEEKCGFALDAIMKTGKPT